MIEVYLSCCSKSLQSPENDVVEFGEYRFEHLEAYIKAMIPGVKKIYVAYRGVDLDISDRLRDPLRLYAINNSMCVFIY